MGKANFLIFILLTGVNALFAQQGIDRSQYEEATIFDVKLWWDNDQTRNNDQTLTDKKFKATVLFDYQSGTTIYFADLDRQSRAGMTINRRWPVMTNGQQVTIYFTTQRARSMVPVIDDIDYNNVTQVRPWQAYIDDGVSGKKGWYLRSLGNGRYEEIFYP
jgi:hypothetical protein